MRAWCFASASPSVISWPLVMGSLKSGALSPTCSTPKSLLELQNVPAVAGGAGYLIAARQRVSQRLAKRHAPRPCGRGIVATQRDDVRGHLDEEWSGHRVTAGGRGPLGLSDGKHNLCAFGPQRIDFRL